eukprot:ctg_1042.g388
MNHMGCAGGGVSRRSGARGGREQLCPASVPEMPPVFGARSPSDTGVQSGVVESAAARSGDRARPLGCRRPHAVANVP